MLSLSLSRCHGNGGSCSSSAYTSASASCFPPLDILPLNLLPVLSVNHLVSNKLETDGSGFLSRCRKAAGFQHVYDALKVTEEVDCCGESPTASTDCVRVRVDFIAASSQRFDILGFNDSFLSGGVFKENL